MSRKYGKIEQVMVACIVDEVVKVVRPAEIYNVDRIHLISFIKEPEDDEVSQKRSAFYHTVLSAVIEQLDSKRINYMIHREDETYRFDSMMSAVYNIVRKECDDNGNIVYLNISEGTGEYSAAAMLVSMMFDEAHAFSVGALRGETSVDYDKMLEMRKDNQGNLVGTAREIHEPFPISAFPIEPPDMMLLAGLKVFDSIPEKKRKNASVIRSMIDQGIWLRFPPSESRKDCIEGTSVELASPDNPLSANDSKDVDQFKKRRNKELKQYAERYQQKWLDNGWIEENKGYGAPAYSITDAGRTCLKIFIPDDVFRCYD